MTTGLFRPSGYLAWASAGATNVVEPPDLTKSVGWGIGEQPPSSYFNWLLQKQDTWIQYLGSKIDNVRTVVDDDFIRSTQVVNHTPGSGLAGNGVTGLLPLWDSSNLGTVTVNYNNPGAVPAGLGAVLLGSVGGGSGLDHYVRTFVDGLGFVGRDFLMESWVAGVSLGGSGSQLCVGAIPYSFSGTYGYYFSTTGPSSTWALNYGTSAVPASIALPGSYAASPSSYQKLVIERIGSTMMARINDATVAVLGGVTGTAQFMPMLYGVTQRHIGANGFRIVVDKLKITTSGSP